MQSWRKAAAPGIEAVQRATGRTLKMAWGWNTTRSAASTDTCITSVNMCHSPQRYFLIALKHPYRPLIVCCKRVMYARLACRTACVSRACLVLEQMRPQLLGELLLIDEEGVGQLLLLLQQAIQKRLQLLGGDIVRQIQLGSCMSI